MDRQVIAEVNIIPVGTGDTGVSKFVAACMEVLERTPDVEYRLTPMGTVMQGSLDRILQIAKEMHEETFNAGALRVVTSLRIDDRRDRPQTMNDKVQSVLRRVPAVKV